MTTISGINPSFLPNLPPIQASDAAQAVEQLLNSYNATSAGGSPAPRIDTGTNTRTGSSGAPRLSSDVLGALLDDQAQQTGGSSTALSQSGSTTAGAARASASASSAVPPGLVAINPNDPTSVPLPTPALLQKYSDQLTQSVNALLAQNGISQTPALSFSVDPNTAQVTVTGNRPDTAQIQSLINSDPSLKAQFHQVAAVGSQLSVFQQGLKAVDAYLAAKTPQQVQEVISQYYSGSPTQTPDISLTYNGTSIEVDSNGHPLLTPQQQTAAPSGSAPPTLQQISGRYDIHHLTADQAAQLREDLVNSGALSHDDARTLFLINAIPSESFGHWDGHNLTGDNVVSTPAAGSTFDETQLVQTRLTSDRYFGNTKNASAEQDILNVLNSLDQLRNGSAT